MAIFPSLVTPLASAHAYFSHSPTVEKSPTSVDSFQRSNMSFASLCAKYPLSIVPQIPPLFNHYAYESNASNDKPLECLRQIINQLVHSLHETWINRYQEIYCYKIKYKKPHYLLNALYINITLVQKMSVFCKKN